MTETPVTSLDQLLGLLGPPPSTRAVEKVHSTLTEDDRSFLAQARFCVLATCDAESNLDASPKGDPAGTLVHVLDDATIALAERPGNRRADGYRNILVRPKVGTLFIIPGRSDTLRVNGRARLVCDAPWFDELSVLGRRPILALVVEIEEIFSHCVKAFVRSQLWQPESWGLDGQLTDVGARAARRDEAIMADYSSPLY